MLEPAKAGKYIVGEIKMRRRKLNPITKILLLVIGLLIGANVSCMFGYFESGIPQFSQWVAGWLILVLILEIVDSFVTHTINIFILSVVFGSSLGKTIQPTWGILLLFSTICILILLLVVYSKSRMRKIVVEDNSEDPE